VLPALPAFALGDRLELDRAAVARGEVWRLLTCHWTHWTPDHLLWDSLAFLVLAFLCEARVGRGRLLAAVAGSALAVSAAVWFLPEIETYRGLSGIDSALFVLLAVSLMRERPLAGLALAAFLGKSAWEVATGSTLFVDAASFVPVPLAHLVGGAWGMIVGIVGIAGRPPRAWQKLRAGRRLPFFQTVSRVRSGNSPAASGTGAGPSGRPRSGRCRNW
jgi:rhomboid family GlyGly-CTERM serine protease